MASSTPASPPGTEVTVDEPDMYLPEGDVTATNESPNEPADTTKGGDAE